MKYRPNVSTVKCAPSLRMPVRSHWSPDTDSNRVAASAAWAGRRAGWSCSP